MLLILEWEQADRSLKTIQLPNVNPGFTFAFVIQRADVITKAAALGFPGLTVDSPPATLGEAIELAKTVFK